MPNLSRDMEILMSGGMPTSYRLIGRRHKPTPFEEARIQAMYKYHIELFRVMEDALDEHLRIVVRNTPIERPRGRPTPITFARSAAAQRYYRSRYSSINYFMLAWTFIMLIMFAFTAFF